ncbi:DnaJ domain-containing protein [Candidatus Comchoanobacter bicostacola]|uniref:DnaJ domain-containing protein n=1 Tax=Candidatus Comchoanobacter bicostacola TaxID=2919598 RepID=A0ABY5DJ83_9GAMM|nr:DnaJ domain-containing protein [Candidatus Comchoanobacter bicostacola]UTC24616.1 DnaJ domain-containing protein [Candidatus Comchoanobacter bicostacola]
MSKTAWFFFGILITTMFRAPLYVGIILGIYLAYKFGDPIPTFQWSNHFHTFSVASYHHHLFSSLGLLAKADGVISQAEISYAKQHMQKIGLNFHQTSSAKNSFKEGSMGLNLNKVCTYMQIISMQNPTLVEQFLLVCEGICHVDGAPSRNQINILNQIKFYTQRQNQNQHQYRQQTNHQPFRAFNGIQNAYQTLGVSANTSLADVKKAYRRLLSKYHPDRHPDPKKKKIAEEKVKEFHSAWDTIRKQHADKQRI